MQSTKAILPRTQKILAVLLLLAVYIPFLDLHGQSLIDKLAWDFPSFYYAGQLTFDLGISPYVPENWIEAERLHDGTVYAFLYPPPSLPFFRPLNFLSYENAKVLMLFINHLLILVFGYLFFFKLFEGELTDLFFLFGAVYTLSFYPLQDTLHSGQVNLLLLVLLTLVWLAVKQNRHPGLIALPLAFAILLKLYPAIFLFYLLLRRNYKAIAWTVGILLLLAVATLPFLPASAWPDWMAEVAGAGYGNVVRGQLPTAVRNQSLNGLTARLFLGHADKFGPLIPSPLAARVLPLVLSGLVGLATLALVFRAEQSQLPDRLDDSFALFLLTIFLVAPISWDYHLTFALPAILL
ncbi:MAG TPA: glycosyltransferase family 87 protein, partial [Anaerolineales bacterium]|nr:glycosyltransferase family 87 protein [Anaerolineales bacterium]